MIEKILYNSGLRKTKGRKEVFDFLLKNKGKHFSALDIYNKLKTKGVSLTTIYRTLSILEKTGVVKGTSFSKRHMSYEIFKEPHIHLICSNCGKIKEIKAPEIHKLFETLDIKNSLKTFDPLFYIIEIYGICENCKK